MENFIRGRGGGVSLDPQKYFREKTHLFYGKWGGGTHPIHIKLNRKG